MPDLVLDSITAPLASLARAWLAGGAYSYGIWADGQPLAQWRASAPAPESGCPVLGIEFETEDGESLELRVTGVEGELAVARLRGEAELLAGLIQSEADLDAVTSRLIETQDQLLALYDLTHGARNHLDIQSALESLAREAARLLRSASAFAVLALPDGPPLLAQQPVPCLSQAQVLGLFAEVQAQEQELLRSVEIDEPEGDAAAGPCLKGDVFVVPIPVRGEISASLGLLSTTGQPFTSPDMKLARTIADQIGTQMENALLLQDTLAQARVQTEMELARRVQSRLLPQAVPKVSGLSIAARSRPALELGGDFYDFVCAAGRPLMFALGDVSGKGMSAALIMSMMHTSVRALGGLKSMPSPAASIAITDSHLYDDLTEIGSFVTMFFGKYDPGNRLLSFANAGHSPVILCPVGGQPRMLEADSPPVGVLPMTLAEDQCCAFGPGDLLVVATDGFSEAQNAEGEMFGYPRLLELTCALSKLSAAEVLEGLFAAIDDFSAGHPQDDDQTAVVLKGVPA
jgi:phosphoserine phosphatase RsbU/P